MNASKSDAVLTTKERQYFNVARVRKTSTIQTGIASFEFKLECLFAREVCRRDSPTGWYVFGRGGSPMVVSPCDVQ